MVVRMPMSNCTLLEAQAIVVKPACTCVNAEAEIFNVHSSQQMLWLLVLQKAHHDCRPSSSPNLFRYDFHTALHGLAWAVEHRIGCKPLGSPK